MKIKKQAYCNQGRIGPWTLESGRKLCAHLAKQRKQWQLTADFTTTDLTPEEYREYQGGPRKELKQYLWMILKRFGHFDSVGYNELTMNTFLAKAGL